MIGGGVKGGDYGGGGRGGGVAVLGDGLEMGNKKEPSRWSNGEMMKTNGNTGTEARTYVRTDRRGHKYGWTGADKCTDGQART